MLAASRESEYGLRTLAVLASGSPGVPFFGDAPARRACDAFERLLKVRHSAVPKHVLVHEPAGVEDSVSPRHAARHSHAQRSPALPTQRLCAASAKRANVARYPRPPSSHRRGRLGAFMHSVFAQDDDKPACTLWPMHSRWCKQDDSNRSSPVNRGPAQSPASAAAHRGRPRRGPSRLPLRSCGGAHPQSAGHCDHGEV